MAAFLYRYKTTKAPDFSEAFIKIISIKIKTIPLRG